MTRNPITRADVSGTGMAQAVARVYLPPAESTAPPLPATPPDDGLDIARGVVAALCIASVLWSCVVVYLSFTL